VNIIPLGRRESGTLEFKQKDALNRPDAVGREIVGFLNAGGGNVWIGLREEHGTAVALDPIENPEAAMGSLRDYLMDALEPPPLEGEVRVNIIRDEAGRAVLRVYVRPIKSRKPYALLKGGARYFYIRSGDRLRSMSREEIFSPRASEGNPAASAESGLRRERDKLQRKGEGVYWICLKPYPEARIDVHDPDIHGYLQDARRTGNRPIGWNFISPYEQPELHQGRLVQGRKVGRIIEVHEDGTLSLTVDINELHHSRREQEIHPFPLIEYPVALFRLASCLYRDKEVAGSGKVFADTALIGIRDWKLRPYSPRSIHFEHPLEPLRAWADDRDLVWERPLVFPGKEMVEEPDWCGFRLVRRIYEAFGYFENQIPQEFDRSSRRLVIPD